MRWRLDATNVIDVFYSHATDDWRANFNGTIINGAAETFAIDEEVGIAITADFYNDSYHLYVNGVDYASSAAALVIPDLRDADLYLAAQTASNQLDGVLYDLRFWDEVLTPTEVLDIYNAGRGRSVQPYLGSRTGQNTNTWSVELENRNDGANGSWVEAGNVPGDLPCPILFHVGDPVCSGGGNTGVAWYANQRHVIAKTDYIWEGEGASAFGADWAAPGGGATESGADYARCTFTATLVWRTLSFNILQTLREMFDYRGQWRLFARVKTCSYTTTLFRAYFSDSANPIPSSTGMSCDQNNVWEMQDMGMIDIPQSYYSEKLVSGEDWAAADASTRTLYFEAYATAGTPTFDLDYLMFMPGGMLGRWGDTSAADGRSIASGQAYYDASDSVSYESAASYYIYHDNTLDPLFSFSGIWSQTWRGNSLWLEVLDKNRIPMIINRHGATIETDHEIRDTFQCFALAQPRWRRMR